MSRRPFGSMPQPIWVLSRPVSTATTFSLPGWVVGSPGAANSPSAGAATVDGQ
jgi:hypothetical protein